MIPAAIDPGIGIQVWGPIDMGLLTGKYRRDRQPEDGARMVDGDGSELQGIDRENLYDMVDRLEEIATDRDATIPQVVLASLLTRPGVTNLAVGARTPDQLWDSIGALSLELTRGRDHVSSR